MASNTTEKVDFLTREGAALATADDLKTILSSLKRKVDGVNTSAGNLREAAAYATHTAFRVDEDMTFQVFADKTGISRSQVYIDKRMGVAMLDLGVQRGDDTYALLSGKAGANVSVVANILDGLGRDGLGDPETRTTDPKTGKVRKGKANILPTEEDLAWALDLAFAKDEATGTVTKRKSADVETLRQKALGTYVEPVVEEPSAEEILRTVEARAAASAQYLIDNLADVSVEGFAAIDDLLKQVFQIGKAKREVVKAAAAA